MAATGAGAGATSQGLIPATAAVVARQILIAATAAAAR